jgi:hypothetical protein
MLKFQKEFHQKLQNFIGKGKFGNDIEGIVVSLGHQLQFKIISDKFKEAKKAYNQEYKK